MAVKRFNVIENFDASGVIRANRFVKMYSAHTVEECDTAGEAADGISQEAATDGDRIDVCTFGWTKVSAGAQTTVNTWLSTAADGQATDNDASDDYLLAKGYEAATAADEEISVFFRGPAGLDKVGD